MNILLLIFTLEMHLGNKTAKKNLKKCLRKADLQKEREQE